MARSLLMAGIALSAIALPGTGFIGAAHAQATSGDSDEIVVTAQRREEHLMEIPLAVQAIGGEALQDAGVVTLQGLQQVTPTFTVALIAGDPVIAMRGIGGEVNQIGGEPSIAVSVDGVPFARQQYFLNAFFDVDRVEVLRGPQGTINGRNSTGGAVNIVSRGPTDDFEAGIDVTAGNYNAISTDSYISGPLIGDQLLGRLAIRTNKRDGFMENTDPNGTPDSGDVDEVMARGSLLLRPADYVSFQLTLDSYSNDINGAPLANMGLQMPQSVWTVFAPLGFPSGPTGDLDDLKYETDTNDNYFRQDVFGGAFRSTWDFGPNTTLTTITGYREFDIDWKYEPDVTSFSIVDIKEPFDQHQISQEVTLTSAIGENFDWLIGGLYLKDNASIVTDVLYTGGLQVGTGFEAVIFQDDQELESESAYAQARWRFVPGWQLTLGGRYTRDEKHWTEVASIPNASLAFAFSGEDSWNAFTPRAALDYRPNDDMTLYVSASRGFKAGGFGSGGGLATGGANTFEPEYVWNYEAGMKSRWLDNRLQANVTVFHADYTDLQVPFYIPPATRIVNAASATIEGVELEFVVRPTDALQIGLNATYLDASYDEFCATNPGRPDLAFPGVPAGCPATTPAGAHNLEGNQMPRAPDWSLTANAAYAIHLSDGASVTLRADYQWQSQVYFTPFEEENLSQDDYGLLNLRATYETSDRRWQVSAFGRNVTDERYFNNLTSLGINLGVTDGTNIYPGATVLGTVGEPQMYGVSVGYHY